MNPNTHHILKVAMAGGGTGGHLAPGLAVAESLIASTPCLVTFLTTGRAAEQQMLLETPFPQIQIPACPPQGGLRGMLRFARRSAAGLARSLAVLGKLKPHALVALGGYGAFTPALAARLLGIPVVAFEQNAVPGRVTRWLARFAHTVFCQWQLEPRKLSPRARQVPHGNPVRKCITEASAKDAWDRFELDPLARTIVVLGGSQGARALNDAVLRHRRVLARYAGAVQVLLVTGAADYPRVQAALGRQPGVRAVPFVHEMGALLAAADVVVSRAGATAISECTATGTPMVLVPYPAAKDQHQHVNARLMVEMGAALTIEEAHFDALSWRVVIEEVALSSWNRAEMAMNAAAVGRPDAAAHVARDLEHILQASANRRAPEARAWMESGRHQAVTLAARQKLRAEFSEAGLTRHRRAA